MDYTGCCKRNSETSVSMNDKGHLDHSNDSQLLKKDSAPYSPLVYRFMESDAISRSLKIFVILLIIFTHFRFLNRSWDSSVGISDELWGWTARAPLPAGARFLSFL
jgi:hypothetical protein